MTSYQEKAIEKLKSAFFKHYSFGRPEEHEFKEIHVESGKLLKPYMSGSQLG